MTPTCYTEVACLRVPTTPTCPSILFHFQSTHEQKDKQRQQRSFEISLYGQEIILSLKVEPITAPVSLPDVISSMGRSPSSVSKVTVQVTAPLVRLLSLSTDTTRIVSRFSSWRFT